MNKYSRFICLSVGLVLASSAFARIERVVTKRFDVQPGGSLTIDSYEGSIHVSSSNDAVVTVEVRQSIAANTDSEADTLLKDVTLTFEQKNSVVNVSARSELVRQGGLLGAKTSPVELKYVVTIPRTFNVDLKTAGGEVQLDDLKGNANIRTSGGSLKLGKIDGTIDGRTSGGGIQLASCSGKTLLRTSGGTLKIGQLGGPADVSTSGGGIQIDGANDVLRAHTSGGSIRFELVGPLKGDCSAETSGGGIEASVDPKGNFNLDASTSGGSVTFSIPVTVDSGATGKHQVKGKVNAGGPVLKLRTSGGNIQIKES